jgi:DNA uptake protein ComE-like DNA-binding protein
MIKAPQTTNRTKIGFILWTLLLAIVTFTPRFIRTFFPEEPFKISVTTDKQIKTYRKTSYTRQRSYRLKRYRVPPCRFNPNEYTLEQWMYLGLTRKQAAVVLKFCKYPLTSNKDLKRIFVIPEELFNAIKDSTYYPISQPTYHFSDVKEKTPSKQLELVSIQDLDSVSLLSIQGIGPYYAKMIMRYEKALGGFHAKEQLLEVYKMNDATYAILCKHLDFSHPKIRKISINYASADALEKHPYISRWQANSIVKMRIQLGGFQSIQELRKSHLISEEDFDKLEPYVSL